MADQPDSPDMQRMLAIAGSLAAQLRDAYGLAAGALVAAVVLAAQARPTDSELAGMVAAFLPPHAPDGTRDVAFNHLRQALAAAERLKARQR